MVVPSGQLLDYLQKGGVVERAVALRPRCRDKLRDHTGDWQRDPGGAAGGERDPHVLVVKLDPEPGLELPGQHRGRLQVEDAVAGQTSGEHFEATLAVDAGSLQ